MRNAQLILRAICAGLVISLATSLACTRDKPAAIDGAIRQHTYTLVLIDTTNSTPQWLAKLRKDSSRTVAVSGYAGETSKALLQRLPWLLQPGVDTIVYDQQFLGPEIADSLRQKLVKLSPATVLLIQ